MLSGLGVPSPPDSSHHSLTPGLASMLVDAQPEHAKPSGQPACAMFALPYAGVSMSGCPYRLVQSMRTSKSLRSPELTSNACQAKRAQRGKGHGACRVLHKRAATETAEQAIAVLAKRHAFFAMHGIQR